MKRIAKRWLTGIVSVLAFCAIGFGVNVFQNEPEEVVTASAATISTDITMKNEPEIRTYTASGGSVVGTEKPALRFTVELSAAAAQNVVNGESRVGILVSTADILKGCSTGDYFTYMEDKAGYRAEARSAEHLVNVNGTSCVRFSLTNISFNNLDRNWAAIGYVRDATSGEILKYTSMSGEYDVEYIASKALNNGNTFTYVNSQTMTSTTPVIEWVQQATYKKAGVTYDKNAANEKYYLSNGNAYTYAELKTALTVNEAAADAYPMNGFSMLDSMLVGETHALGSHSGVNIKYTSSNESVLKVSSTGTVSAVGAGSAHITASIGSDSAGNAVEYSTSEVTVAAHGEPSLAQLSSGYSYNWHSSYMNVTNDGGSKAGRYETSFTNCSGIAMYLNAGNNWWLDGLRSGYNLTSSSTGNYMNKYTITLYTYCTEAGQIHLQTQESYGVATYDTAYVNAGENTVQFTYVGWTTRLGIHTSMDVGLGNVVVSRGEVYTGYGTTNPFGDTSATYTWDICGGNFVGLTDNYSYTYVSTITDQNTRKALINTGYFGDNYALHVYPGSGSSTTLTFANGKTNVYYAYYIRFTAYLASGSPSLAMYDDNSGTRREIALSANALGNGMYEYTSVAILDGDNIFDRLMLYGQSGMELWISSMSATMYRRVLGAEYAFDHRIMAEQIYNQHVANLGHRGDHATLHYDMTLQSTSTGGYTQWVQLNCWSKELEGGILVELFRCVDWIENYNHGAWTQPGTIRLYWYQSQGWGANEIYLTYGYDEGAAQFLNLQNYSGSGMRSSEHTFPVYPGNRVLFHAKNRDHTVYLCEIRITGVTRPWAYA